MHASREKIERVNREIGDQVELSNRKGAAQGQRQVLFWDVWPIIGNATALVKTWKKDVCKCHFAHVFAVEQGIEGVENQRLVRDLTSRVPCMLTPSDGLGRPQWCLS